MKIPKLSATLRIVLSLVSLSTSLLLVAAALGFFPDGTSGVTAGRSRLCESLAISFSAMARHTDVDTMKHCFEIIVSRNPEILTLGIRKDGGSLLLEVGNHSAAWTLQAQETSTETQMVVPVYAGDRQWGAMEVRFRPITTTGFASFLFRPEFTLAAFMGVASLLSYYLYLRKVLRQLNPSKVIPGRVREAFDSLSEGLVVLDQQERVVLVNRAFEQVTGKTSEQLVGQSASALRFVSREETPGELFPWQETIAQSRPVRGRLLGLNDDMSQEKVFSVSSAPIMDEQGSIRGALTSFEDVSRLERKKRELLELVEHLHASAKQIRIQNQALEVLASRDSLTGCLNRRAFLETFESLWHSAERYGYPLSLLMVDIDHFKSVNDQHGHAVGDQVLRKVATTLRDTARNSDIVCRFGGEEFAVLLPHTDINQAELAAEKFRITIEQLHFARLSVTVSLGISALSENPRDPQDLLSQADKCLYVAKRNGRNQVIRRDKVPPGLELDDNKVSRIPRSEHCDEPTSIPYHAVTALFSALAYRDQETAAHSRRVADLCVAAAEGLLSLKDCYTLEIAALLHDIGKIGVPDSILLKPGVLTTSEWEIMRSHGSIGDEIIRASFQSPGLSEIVENYRAFFGGQAAAPGLPSGRDIPVGARILAIADAYDAIVSHRVYREARSQDEAVAELRLCAGTQFDPELVERFVRMIRTVYCQPPVPEAAQVSREAALNIGTQIERLMTILDEQDMDKMLILSQRLSRTATKYGAAEIAEKAAELETCFQDDSDVLHVMQTANELLDLCRATQSSFLQGSRERHVAEVAS